MDHFEEHYVTREVLEERKRKIQLSGAREKYPNGFWGFIGGDNMKNLEMSYKLGQVEWCFPVAGGYRSHHWKTGTDFWDDCPHITAFTHAYRDIEQ